MRGVIDGTRGPQGEYERQTMNFANQEVGSELVTRGSVVDVRKILALGDAGYELVTMGSRY